MLGQQLASTLPSFPRSPQFQTIHSLTDTLSHTSDSWQAGHMHGTITTQSQAPSSAFVGSSALRSVVKG